MRIIFLLLFTNILLIVNAQNGSKPESDYTIYINQPIGFYNKVRLSLEKNLDSNYSLLINYTNFYGLSLSTGMQSYLELRRYSKESKGAIFFVYTKAGGGHSFGTRGMYGLFGLGVGKKIYLDKKKRISFTYNMGVKVCPNIIGDDDPDTASPGLHGLFYVTGPGAIIDLNFNFGYRF